MRAAAKPASERCVETFLSWVRIDCVYAALSIQMYSRSWFDAPYWALPHHEKTPVNFVYIFK